MKTVVANIDLLMCYSKSMAVALAKAKNGSQAEDMYFLEKLEKTAKLLGYTLTEDKS